MQKTTYPHKHMTKSHTSVRIREFFPNSRSSAKVVHSAAPVSGKAPDEPRAPPHCIYQCL